MWFTADPHFGHRNIIEYTGRKFKTVQDMDKLILDNMNTTITKDEDFYILGDLTMYGPNQRDKIESYIKRMPGRKHLVLGNHDRCKPFDYLDMGFLSVHTSLKVEEFYCVHDPAVAGVYTGDLFFCGHVHQLFIRQRNALNVGVDVWDMKPVHIDTLREMFDDNRLPAKTL